MIPTGDYLINQLSILHLPPLPILDKHGKVEAFIAGHGCAGVEIGEDTTGGVFQEGQILLFVEAVDLGPLMLEAL
jgi:hypothetical protein